MGSRPAIYALAMIVVGLSGCATSGAVAVGPTIDGDGHLGLEVDGAEGGIGNGNGLPVANLWIAGLEATVGVTAAHPYAWLSGGVFLEYLRLGSPQAPWGFHTRLELGLASWTWGHGMFIAKVAAGPEHVGSQITASTNDGPTTTSELTGADLSLRVRLGWTPHSPLDPPSPEPAPASRWALGLLYVHQETVLY